MSTSRRRRRSPAVALLSVLSLLTAGLAATASAAVPDEPRVEPHPEKIASELTSKFRSDPTQEFWVKLGARADNTAARSIQDWGERGQVVYDGLRATADQSQSVVRRLLDDRKADYDTYWISNAVRVHEGTSALALELSGLMSVASIFPPVVYQQIEPLAGHDVPKVDAVEWGIANINADDVWDEFGVRGEDIVVANIDTGVEFDHPALVEQYRGNLGDGNFDHNYNWYDAAGTGSEEPIDFEAHGTHTMGTMVGDDGEGNQIGVAPGAQWIAANGCCPSDEALLDSMEWMLAPRDLTDDESTADPSKRPNIINNSWGSTIPSNDPFGEDFQLAWEDAGIFGMWSNGNSGPSCETSGSPGSRLINYSSGAYDVDNVIAEFSGRGPGQDGEIKPNISGPGVDVRSSIPGGEYEFFSGTSMASPHVAGAVALLWSAAPTMVGDIAGTRDLLNETAIDVDDTSCGGTEDDNNVWGEGRLDALALLQSAPIGPTGTLAGTVTSAESGDPIAGATLTITGPQNRQTRTDENGEYDLLLPVGTYVIEVTAFGYVADTTTAKIKLDKTTTVDFELETADTYQVSGKVTAKPDGEPAAGATVTLEGTPLVTETNAKGRYRFSEVPVGTYDITAQGNNCTLPKTKSLVVADGAEKINFKLNQKTDQYGYFCAEEAANYVEAENLLPFTGDEVVYDLELPFEFTLYGQRYTSAQITDNGYLSFQESDFPNFGNTPLPDPVFPNATIAPYWDDLFIDEESQVFTSAVLEGNRSFTIEYRNVAFYGDIEGLRVDFEMTLYENGEILFAYRNLDPASDREQGSSTTVGIENADGTDALEYSYNEDVLDDETAIRIMLPPHGSATGTVTDNNDGQPISGATVRAWQDDEVVRQTTTDAAGEYFLQLPLGTYTLEVSKTNYVSETASITIDDEGEIVVTDFVLETAVAEVDPESLEFVAIEGQVRTAEVTITNTGTQDLTWEAVEVDRGHSRIPPMRPANRGADDLDSSATDARRLYSDEQIAAGSQRVLDPGDVLEEWATEGMIVPWGVGYTGDVWISDPSILLNKEFLTDGTPTGLEYTPGWAGEWAGDMAMAGSEMCQVNVGGDNGIYCWNPADGEVMYSLTGSPWANTSQRGLAYNPIDDVFYIGGWNEGILYTVAGQSHAEPGATISECMPEDGSISGLAFNSTSGTLWVATNSPTDTFFQIVPSDCATISTLDDPGGQEFSGAGIELDAAGNIWATDQVEAVARLIESGVPQSSDVPWLELDPISGALAPGESTTVTVTVDTTGLEPGTTYEAAIVLQTNAGRRPNIQVPIQLVVPAYQVGVNVGGSIYDDSVGDRWAADRQYSSGEWGWISQRTEAESTTKAIGGTEEDPLYQDRRTGIFRYQFDNVPAGAYRIDLGFAELSQNYRPGQRIFDVTINGSYVLVAHDVAAEVRGLWADDHSFVIDHAGGNLLINFIDRFGYDLPIVNAIRVTERSDM